MYNLKLNLRKILYPIPYTLYPKKGFTLIESLIAVSIFAIIGILALDLLNRSLQGSSKADVLLKIKQNGQVITSSLEDSIRNADSVICVGEFPDSNHPNTTLVLTDNGKFTRYRMYLEDTLNSQNGFIAKDFPAQEASGNSIELCASDSLQSGVSPLTDTDTINGVSLVNGSFKLNPKEGFKDIVDIELKFASGVSAPKTVESQINPVSFRTSVILR